MNFKRFFAEAEEAGVSPFEISCSSSEILSIDIFQDEIEGYTSAKDMSIIGRGIYKGNIGAFKSDRVDSRIVDTMIEAVQNSACYGKKGDGDLFIKNGLKYKKVHAFNKDTDAVKPQELIDLGKRISSSIRQKEKRITVCSVGMKKETSSSVFQNSNGVSLKSKSNYISLYTTTKIVQGEEVESYVDFVFISSLKDFDVEAFIDRVVEKTVSKLGGHSLKTGTYNVIYSPDCVALLLPTLLNQLSSKEVHQHVSVFEGKLHQQVLSKKLTVKEDPWANNVFSSSFDDEGVPTSRKTLIDKGVINTYFYDLENAKEDGVSSAGNAGRERAGLSIVPALSFLSVKKGSKSLEELALTVNNGVYITDLEGIGTGMNPQSGDYSLQASGYEIQDGKITKPVSLITVAGNLMKDFGKIIALGNDVQLEPYGISTPSIAIRKLSISGI